MLKLRHTLDRIRGRPPGAKSERTHRSGRYRFPKLHNKLNFIKKIRGHKKPAASSTEENEDDNNKNLQVTETDKDGFAVVEVKVDPPDDEDEKAAVEVDADHDNNGNIEIVVNAECYDEGDGSSIDFLRPGESQDCFTPDQLSLVSNPPSRSSMISQNSMANASLLNYKKFIDTRTVWTQTEIEEDVAKSTTSLATNISSCYTLGDIGIGESRIDPSSCASINFGVDDAFLREPVENPKLAAMRDTIVATLRCPDLTQCDPEVSVRLLGYAKLPFLWKLNKRLGDEDGVFNEEFIAYRGLDCLLVMMEDIANRGIVGFADVMRMLLVSECATTLVNSPSGRDFIINHGEHVVSLARGTELDLRLPSSLTFLELSSLAEIFTCTQNQQYQQWIRNSFHK